MGTHADIVPRLVSSITGERHNSETPYLTSRYYSSHYVFIQVTRLASLWRSTFRISNYQSFSQCRSLPVKMVKLAVRLFRIHITIAVCKFDEHLCTNLHKFHKWELDPCKHEFSGPRWALMHHAPFSNGAVTDSSRRSQTAGNVV